MVLPPGPVTLSVEQIDELNKQLTAMRHDVNNNISLIVAAVELIRMKPHMTAAMMETISSQPSKITDRIAKFSAQFEKTFGVTRK